MRTLYQQHVYSQQHAELLISQDALERKVAQMKFLISFYESTRFMLERDRIAEEFLRLVCSELGFVAGLAFTSVAGSSSRLDAAFDADSSTTVVKNLRRKFEVIPIGSESSATLFFYDTENRKFKELAELYKSVGIAEPYNSAVIEIYGESTGRIQLHLVNWLHGPLFDPSTTELLHAMLRPLELSRRFTLHPFTRPRSLTI